jgi:1-acylglycerone phosphate reductase
MKHALVTGCSRGGIGFALCHALSTKGIHVFATARTLSRMTELQDLPNVTLLALDVTNKASIAAAVEAVRKETGGTLDYLFNNAGMSQAMPLLDADLDEGRAMFEVNVWGAVAMVQAFAPLLIAAQGTVVNLASLVVSLHTLWTCEYLLSHFPTIHARPSSGVCP